MVVVVVMVGGGDGSHGNVGSKNDRYNEVNRGSTCETRVQQSTYTHTLHALRKTVPVS